MTVGELRRKLELYKDDVEIFMHHYDDLCCQDWYSDPFVAPDTVRTYTTKKGYVTYTNYSHQEHSKQHTVLVIS